MNHLQPLVRLPGTAVLEGLCLLQMFIYLFICDSNVSVCLSVRLPQAGIVSKRKKLDMIS